MNEQNITNIIEYLDQNPDQTIEVLVQNLLNEGYPVEDVKAALDRQGISPLVIPGYKETIVYSSPGRSFSGKLLIVTAIIFSLIILGVVIYIVYGYLNRNAANNQIIPSQQAGQSSTPAVGTNIAAMLKEPLAKEDYKIVINNITVYTDNGAIARLEKNDGKIYLDWSSAVTILDPGTKTYKTYFYNTTEGDQYNNTKLTDVIPLEIIANTESGKIVWKQIDATTWESGNLPRQRITIDPVTKLITRRTMINPDGSVSQEEIISYEQISITEELVGIPSGYTPAP